MSSWYRTIDAGMWGDDKFRRLSRPSACGQYLWIYLLTGDHTDGLPGLYRLGEASLAEALDWPIVELRSAFAELAALHMALADISAHVVYLPNALKYQAPTNPKHLQGWGKAYRRIPECELRTTWLQQLYVWAESKGIAYVHALTQGFDTVSDSLSDRVSAPNPHPHPHSNTHKRNVALLRNGDPAPALEEEIPFGEIIAHLNERAGKRFRHGNENTRRHIQARWREGFRLPDFLAVIDTKCASWLGTEFEPYLRPQTLFASKFESYRNERGTGDTSAASLYPDLDQPQEDRRDS